MSSQLTKKVNNYASIWGEMGAEHGYLLINKLDLLFQFQNPFARIITICLLYELTKRRRF